MSGFLERLTGLIHWASLAETFNLQKFFKDKQKKAKEKEQKNKKI